MAVRSYLFPLCVHSVGRIEIDEIQKGKYGFTRELRIFGDEPGDSGELGEAIVLHSNSTDGLAVQFGSVNEEGTPCDDCNLGSHQPLTKWDGRFLCLGCLKQAEKDRAVGEYHKVVTHG